MNRQLKTTLSCSLGLAVALSVSGAWASGSEQHINVLRGEAQVRQSNGQWHTAGNVEVGDWMRSSKDNTTVRVNGVTMRLDKGSVVRVAGSDSSNSKIEANHGRVFVHVDSGTNCQVAMNGKQIQAGGSEFVLDASEQSQLYVLSGQAGLVKSKPALTSLKNWSKSTQVALDGPDVRRANKRRNRFTQGEENKGKRIGEDQPPQTYTPSPSPTFTQTPAYTPTMTPTTPPPSPPPSPTPPPQADGGFDPWPLIGGVLGAGGVAALIILNQDDNEDRVVFPASP